MLRDLDDLVPEHIVGRQVMQFAIVEQRGGPVQTRAGSARASTWWTHRTAYPSPRRIRDASS